MEIVKSVKIYKINIPKNFKNKSRKQEFKYYYKLVLQKQVEIIRFNV